MRYDGFVETKGTEQMTHLDALELRLSHERDFLAKAKTENERQLRRVWIAQIEKEIASEHAFLAKQAHCEKIAEENTMTDDELLAALRED